MVDKGILGIFVQARPGFSLLCFYILMDVLLACENKSQSLKFEEGRTDQLYLHNSIIKVISSSPIASDRWFVQDKGKPHPRGILSLGLD